MAEAETLTPSRDDFAAMLDASFNEETNAEGSVVKGKIIAIEKDLAIIDVGLKTEGRVPLKEFGAKAKDGTLSSATKSKSILERVENAMGEAVLSRDKARREKAGSVWKWRSTPTSASTARSSTRSRAASPSIWTAPWPSCRVPRSTSARCATSPR
jgi:hypothetical protein